jgi:hypothetical protein
MHERNGTTCKITIVRWLEGRVAIVGVLAALFAWFSFGVAVREPYPAAVFPRFGSVPVDEEILPVRFRLLVFSSGADRVELPPGPVFEGPFDSFHNNMLDSLVTADPELTVADPEFIDWVEDRATTVAALDCVDSLEIVEVVSDDSVPRTSLQRFEVGGCR